MERINWTRVVLGGLLAGAVINIGETTWATLFADTLEGSLSDHGLGSTMGARTMLLFVAICFVQGGVAVWLYAALQPQFGPSLRTAGGTGLAVWLLSYLAPALNYLTIGLYPPAVLYGSLAFGLVEVVGGSVLGAKIYRDWGMQNSSKTAGLLRALKGGGEG